MPPNHPIVFSSSLASKQSRVSMDFTNTWGEGGMFEWYGRRRLKSEKSILINRMQIRIDNGKPPHRFVLVFMDDDSIVRFDRRPETSKFGALISEALGATECRKAGDDFCLLISDDLSKITQTTYCEIEVDLKDAEKRDLLLVLSAAFAIANDEVTNKYNLATYNCYFFSWTIVMVVVRHAKPFVLPPLQKVVNILDEPIEGLASSLTKKIVEALLELVLDTITTFRRETGRSLNSGLSKRELMVWGLPTNTVRVMLKGCLKMRLNLGLENRLKEVVHDQLRQNVGPSLEKILVNQQLIADSVHEKLWVDQLMGAFNKPVRKQLLEIVWKVLLEALATGYADMHASTKNIFDHITTDSRIDPFYRLKYRILGENVVQFAHVWNEALNDAIPAASSILSEENNVNGVDDSDPPNPIPPLDSPEGYDEEKMHRDMFNRAFRAAERAALNAAKRVVEETTSSAKNPKRDDMWEVVWSKWDVVWEHARTRTEDKVIKLIKDTMTEIVELLVKNVISAIGNDEAQPVNVTARYEVSKH
ncbi:hypothetical protein RHS03_01236, partial [Rhizoctonia solani]